MNMSKRGFAAKTLPGMLGRRLAAALALFITLGLAALLPQSTAVAFDEPEPSPADILAGIHGCWQGEAPADMQGKFPGHAVMILPDGTTVYSTDISRAMNHVLKTPEPGLTVFAFCR